MNRLLLRASLVAAMLTLVASSAFAVPLPGLNLAWNNCATQGGVQNLDFTCDDNGFQFVAAGSFVLGADLAGVTGVEIILDLISATPTLPAWWDLGPTACRDALAANPGAPFSNTLCRDWAANSAAGGLASYSSDLGSIDPSNTAAHRRILAGFAVGTAKNLLGLTREYYCVNLIVASNGTIAPDPVCAGCTTPVCIVLNSVNVVPGTNAATIVGSPSLGTSAQITWQGGVSANCSAVPTKNATWGQVKALYR